jgi:hypothetical protein
MDNKNLQFLFIRRILHALNCVKLVQSFSQSIWPMPLTLYELQVQQMNLKQEAAVPNETAEQINEHEIKIGGV